MVEGLVADRAYARYTSQVVRYRSGQSSLPPPNTPPPRGDVSLAEAIAGSAQARPVPTQEQSASSYDAFEQRDVNDGGLDDFVEDLVRETESSGPGGTTPGPGAALAPSAASRPESVASRFPAREPLAGGERLLAGFGIRPRPATAPVPAQAVAAIEPSGGMVAEGGPLVEPAANPPAGQTVARQYAQADDSAAQEGGDQPLEVRPVGNRQIKGDIAIIAFPPGATDLPAYAGALLRYAAASKAPRATLVVAARANDIRIAETRAQAVGQALIEAGLEPGDFRLYAGEGGREEARIDQVWR